MTALFRTIRAILAVSFIALTLPFAPFAEDRITFAAEYEKSLGWDDRVRDGRKRWSMLSILLRAAHRQRRLNINGRARFAELQRLKTSNHLVFLIPLQMCLRFAAFAYGFIAFSTILQVYFPVAFIAWEAAQAGLVEYLHVVLTFAAKLLGFELN